MYFLLYIFTQWNPQNKTSITTHLQISKVHLSRLWSFFSAFSKTPAEAFFLCDLPIAAEVLQIIIYSNRFPKVNEVWYDEREIFLQMQMFFIFFLWMADAEAK